jgi:hypothetical protein
MQDQLRSAKEAIAGPVPIIADAPDVMLVLPRGLHHKGAWQREVMVRELTGVDEEALAKVPDQLAFFSSVIALGVESLGEMPLGAMPLAERKHHLGELLLGEREQLFVKIAQVTFGNSKELGFNCTRCQTEQEVTLLLDTDFKPKEVEGVDVVLHQYTSTKGDVLDYRAAIGADQEEAVAKKGTTQAEQNTIMISRCVTKRNGEIIVDPLKFSRNLSIKDRQVLLKLLVDLQPSIDLELKTLCVACGGEQTIALGWGDIFRP